MTARQAHCLTAPSFYPRPDALPDPLHPQNFPDERSRNIYLALPVASDVRNEISDGRRIGRYRLNYADVRDLHSEEGDARTLTLGQLTPRIMSGAEDMSAYITLPLCRISDRHADGSLTLDDDFIPSCQNIQVSKKLRVYLKEVQGPLADGQAIWQTVLALRRRAASRMWRNL